MVLKLQRFAWRITIWAMILLFLRGMGIVTAGAITAQASSDPALGRTSISMVRNETFQLKLKHAFGDITWRSSNSRVARVDSGGRVRAVSAGKCIVYARYDGAVYRCRVQVFRTIKQKRKNEIKTSYSAKKDRGKILLAGSSSIELWTSASTAFAPMEVVNTGIFGTTAAAWLRMYRKLIVKYRPKAVILYMGGNDVWHGRSATATAKVICTLMRKLKKSLSGVPIYFVSLAPNAARWRTWNQLSLINRKVKQFCAEHDDLYYIDCTSYLLRNGRPRKELYGTDMLHFNSKGYAIWNKIVAKRVKSDLNDLYTDPVILPVDSDEITIEQID